MHKNLNTNSVIQRLMESGGSLMSSQKYDTELYPDKVESRLHAHTVFKICFKSHQRKLWCDAV